MNFHNAIIILRHLARSERIGQKNNSCKMKVDRYESTNFISRVGTRWSYVQVHAPSRTKIAVCHFWWLCFISSYHSEHQMFCIFWPMTFNGCKLLFLYFTLFFLIFILFTILRVIAKLKTKLYFLCVRYFSHTVYLLCLTTPVSPTWVTQWK